MCSPLHVWGHTLGNWTGLLFHRPHSLMDTAPCQTDRHRRYFLLICRGPHFSEDAQSITLVIFNILRDSEMGSLDQNWEDSCVHPLLSGLRFPIPQMEKQLEFLCGFGMGLFSVFLPPGVRGFESGYLRVFPALQFSNCSPWIFFVHVLPEMSLKQKVWSQAKWYLNAWLYGSLIQLVNRSASISLYPGMDMGLGERGVHSSPHVLSSRATRKDSFFSLPQAYCRLNLPIKIQVVRRCGTLGSLSLNSKPLPRRVPDNCISHGRFCVEDYPRPQRAEGSVKAKTVWDTPAAGAVDLRLT